MLTREDKFVHHDGAHGSCRVARFSPTREPHACLLSPSRWLVAPSVGWATPSSISYRYALGERLHSLAWNHLTLLGGAEPKLALLDVDRTWILMPATRLCVILFYPSNRFFMHLCSSCHWSLSSHPSLSRLSLFCSVSPPHPLTPIWILFLLVCVCYRVLQSCIHVPIMSDELGKNVGCIFFVADRDTILTFWSKQIVICYIRYLFLLQWNERNIVKVFCHTS
jgi:hypothetical protein